MSASVSAAETYRWLLPVRQASSSVARPSSTPCSASRLTMVTTRRCDSIANDDSSSKRGEGVEQLQVEAQVAHGSGPQQQMDEQAQHGEQEGGREELRRAKDAQLRRNGFDERQSGTGHEQLQPEYRNGREQCAGLGASPVAVPHGRNSAKPMQA